jgi:hypothetical protein
MNSLKIHGMSDKQPPFNKFCPARVSWILVGVKKILILNK